MKSKRMLNGEITDFLVQKSAWNAVGLLLLVILTSLPLFGKDRVWIMPDIGKVIACNLGTCIGAWWSFGLIFRDKRTGRLCSILYSLSVYRLYSIYGRADLEEAAAMACLPLILCCFLKILEEEKKRDQVVFCVIFAGGLTFLLQIHPISGIMACFFLGVLGLALCRKIVAKKNVWFVFFSGVAVALLNARVLERSLRKLEDTADTFEITDGSMIQTKGIYPAQLFLAFFEKGSSSDLAQNGLVEVEAIGIGLPLILPFLVFFFLMFADISRENSEKWVVSGKIAAAFGMVTLILSLSAFPWTQIQCANRWLGSLFYLFSSPQRFLMIATLALTFTAGAVSMWIKGEGILHKDIYVGYTVIVSLFSILTALFYLCNMGG